MKLAPFLMLGTLALASSPLPVARAMTVFEVTVTCPVGGESFKTKSMGSGTATGQNLDRRLVGYIASPWPVAKCPGNGFVMFREAFKDSELARLAAYVETPEYQAAQARETHYYLASLLAAQIESPPLEQVNLLLMATWEAEGDDRYARYAAEALAATERLVASPPATLDAEQRASWQQLAGELERRLGRFEPAKARFQSLLPQVKGTPLEPIVRQELRLVAARDRDTHLADEAPP